MHSKTGVILLCCWIVLVVMILAYFWAASSATYSIEVADVKTVEVQTFDIAVKEEKEGYIFSYNDDDSIEVVFTSVDDAKIKQVEGGKTAKITTWQPESEFARFLLGEGITKKTIEFELDEDALK